MPKYGIIDLGSNTIRLSIFDVDGTDKDSQVPRFKEIVDEKQIVGLSTYVEDGALSSAGVKKATDALTAHLETAHNVGCKSYHVFATAVIRNCDNRAQVVKHIEKEIGCKIDVLSGKDEAHLGLVGAQCSHNIEEGVLIDIGGGSSEVTRVHKKRGVSSVSLKEGCVSTYSKFVKMIFPTNKECDKITGCLIKCIKEQREFPRTGAAEMFGIGGSVRAMAKMHARIKGRNKIFGKLKMADIDEVLKLLVDEPSEFAHLAVKAAPDRLHTLVPGTLIARQLMQSFEVDEITICKYGIREGYLLKRVLDS